MNPNIDDKKYVRALSDGSRLLSRDQALLLFVANGLDVTKTAFALGIEPLALQRVVDAEQWESRLGEISKKIKSSSPGEVERGCNRALNFVMAHRFRRVLERALQVMEAWTQEELTDALLPESVGKNGVSSRRVSTRWAADFSASLDKMAALSYGATGDSATERVKRQADEGGESKIDVHQRIAAVMSGVAESKSPRHLLLEEQLSVASKIADKAIIIRPPPDDSYDKDEN